MGIIPIAYDFTICALLYANVLKFLSSIFEHRKRKKYELALSALSATIILAIVNQWHSIPLNYSTNMVSAILLCFFLYSAPWEKKIIFTAVSVTIAGAIEFFTLPIVSMILREKLDVVSRNSEFQFAYSIINQILLFIILRLIANFFGKRTYSTNNPAPMLLLLLPAASVMVGFTFIYLEKWTPNDTNMSNILIAIASFGLLLGNIIVIYIYDNSIQRYFWESKYLVLERTNQAQVDYYRKLDKYLQDIRVERHNFKNNLDIIDHMACSNQTKEISEYIQTVKETVIIKGDIIEINVNNPALTAILQTKQEICKQKGIRFSLSIEYQDLSFLSMHETCAIFENALNNAVEACAQIKGAGIEKYVNLHVTRFNNLLVIHVENSKMNEILENDAGYVSSKPDPEQHGVGIFSIRNTADKFNGDVSIEHDSYTFSMFIRINIPPNL